MSLTVTDVQTWSSMFLGLVYANTIKASLLKFLLYNINLPLVTVLGKRFRGLLIQIYVLLLFAHKHYGRVRNEISQFNIVFEQRNIVLDF